MSVLERLFARLETLDPTPLVLMPEQSDLPNNAEGGFGGWLAEHPNGFVQLYQPTPVTTQGGVYDTYLVTLDVIALASSVADPLARRVRNVLSRTPRRGRRFENFMPPRPEDLKPEGHRLTLQFQASVPFQTKE